jgi:hypothetical protein
LHHPHGDHYDEHTVEVSDANPVGENPVEAAKHADHMHSDADLIHEKVPHGDHMDYYHDGHLHHAHDDHMDEHGPL